MIETSDRDLRVWIPQIRRGVYPDVMVIEGDPAFHDSRRDEILNPKLVVEVLSHSTEVLESVDVQLSAADAYEDIFG